MPVYDFTRFHPLDHRGGGRRCRTLPGGWRRHLWLAWWLVWREPLVCWWWRCWRLCRWRRHRDGMVEPVGTGAPRMMVCRVCARARQPTGDEIADWITLLKNFGFDA